MTSARPRWLVTGAGGMLGRDLVRALAEAGDPPGDNHGDNHGGMRGAMHGGVDVRALARDDLDITDASAVTAAVAGHAVVVNAAGWTDVDGAETHEAAATAVNGQGVANLAAACAHHGARLLHVSTDYVFAGDATRPYPEDAPTSPVNAYGRSKLAGERAVRALAPAHGYVVRTAWLYGAHGRNFVKTMLRLAGEREHIDVVDDQRGQPTWSYALAQRLVELGHAASAGTAPPGVFHGTASGETTWYGLARAVFAGAGLDPARIRPIGSDRYVLPAHRPAYSVLAHGRWAAAGLKPMADWRDMLTDALPALA